MRGDIEGEITIGDFLITEPYSGDAAKVGIYKSSGEGCDFDKKELEAVIAKFYEERF
jgi:hypothetical protein